MSIEEDFQHLMGWNDDPIRHELSRRQAGIGLFRSVAAPLMATAPATGDLMVYKALKEVLGKYPSYPAQQIGDCESFGHGHGDDLLQCIEIALGEPIEYQETSTEALYAAGREKGNMLGGGDGCYGSAMSAAMLEMGMVPRAFVGDGTYSGKRAKSWGRSGMPQDVRAEASKFKLGSSALVTTYEEMIAAFNNAGVVTVSSNYGFEGRGRGFVRDANGICEAGGTWGHCMLLAGRIDSDGTDTAVIFQSWGDDMPSGPTPFDLPPFAFRARRKVVEAMLAQQDSYALFKTPGFKRRAIPRSWTNAGLAG